MPRIGTLRLGCIALLVGLLAAQAASAQQERITSFRSEIAVHADGSLTVSETIDVVAAGEKIRRGIYRDFPTRYDGRFGLRENVGFELIGVRRDGMPEAARVEPVDNGVRIWIGDPDRRVPAGQHTYVIVYATDRQLRHLADVDELYWNVTGNDWDFPIERAQARVVLPDGAKVVDMAGYTGAVGERGGDYRAAADPAGDAIFSTTRTLRPGEGLTVALSWPKGYVAAPTGIEVAGGRIADNPGLPVAFVGLFLVGGYFLVAWRRVGRDPPKGVIFPRFEGPGGLSPVAVGYIARNGFEHGFSRSDAFAVALVSLAIKGAVDLREEGGPLQVRATADRSRRLPPGEKAVMDTLFADRETVALAGTYEPAVGSAVAALAGSVVREYTDAYFRSNFGVWLPGALLAAAIALAAFLAGVRSFDEGMLAVVLPVFAALFATAPIMLLRKLWPHLVLLVRGRSPKPLANLIGLVFALATLVPAIAILAIVTTIVSVPVLVAVAILIVGTGIFLFLLRAPTMRGRKVLDEIEGYRLYLSVAETDRLDMAAREPEMTLERYETHLPYAMALGVAETWTEKFGRQVRADPGAGPRGYSPRWYATDIRPASGASLTGQLNRTLSRRIASAATAPRSSSGSGSSSAGGGSSGGGGGGGGGGGW